ncbi:hypothetical protein [Micromonospora deserti]|uniref:hypothetical protein n=1 Tax=Micromonospora deserti TaxID=2070366 RepID=UPI000DAA8456|nr:hypothetical protein [Micromonospora deserti]
MAAKIVVVSVVMLAFGTLVSATSFGLTQAIYRQERTGLSTAAPGAFRAVAASALLAPVCALVGMALGADPARRRHDRRRDRRAVAGTGAVPRKHPRWMVAMSGHCPWDSPFLRRLRLGRIAPDRPTRARGAS